MRDAIQAVLDEFRPGLQADGADLLLDEVRDGSVRLRLAFGPDACEECVLPGPDLAEQLAFVLRERGVAVTRVTVDDVRTVGP